MSHRPAWYLHTTIADREWKEAQRAYWTSDALRHGGPHDETCVEWRLLVGARRRYREMVLDGFWRFVAPIGPGHCVPHEAAVLLAEDWDERTRWPS